VRNLKDLFAPKWCRIRRFSELLIIKDLAWAISRRTMKKRQVACRLGVNLHGRDYNLIDSGCQGKTEGPVLAGPFKS
jgi:hypothetical protein